MTSPFLDATLPELLAMVQNGDLSDPELDALCAAACDGEWVEWSELHVEWMMWQESKYHPPRLIKGWHWRYLRDYTSDWREAGRLIEKYRLSLAPAPGNQWEVFKPFRRIVSASPLRAIASAALTVELTRMIEGGSS